MSQRCKCGRFARYDAYYARWWCDRCDREVKPKPETNRLINAYYADVKAHAASRLSARDAPRPSTP